MAPDEIFFVCVQVLCDPEKRAFYDKHGEEGLKLKVVGPSPFVFEKGKEIIQRFWEGSTKVITEIIIRIKSSLIGQIRLRGTVSSIEFRGCMRGSEFLAEAASFPDPSGGVRQNGPKYGGYGVCTQRMGSSALCHRHCCNPLPHVPSFSNFPVLTGELNISVFFSRSLVLT